MSEHTTRLAPTVVLVAAGALIILAIATVALVGRDRIAEYEAGSPEAAAQTYVRSLFEGDYKTAYGLLAPDLQRRCEPEDLALHTELEDSTVHFTDVTELEGSVRIDLTLTDTVYGPGVVPMGRSEHGSRLVLEQIDGEWRIAAAGWPLDACDRR